ncbi:MAG: hypothetical protein Q7S27_00465 [Nanoarchaeota archaeon]|nr:hypothetical protein [Nanoarchaeota archaeon]
MKRGIWIYVLVLVSLTLVPSIPAEIFIGQPSSTVYNIGDSFEINMTLSSSFKKSEFLSTSLICGEKKIELYRSIHSLQADAQKDVTVGVGVDKSIIGDILGECIIEAIYGNDRATSMPFTITDKLDVDFNVEGVSFGPGENVKISGEAIKLNNNALDGFVIITIEGINLSSTQKVENGKFNVSFILPENARSGSYVIKAMAYEKEEDDIINQGESTNVIKIKQILKELRIYADNSSIVPGNDFVYTVFIYDQSGISVEGDVQVVISRPDKSPFYKGLLKSNVPNKLFIGYNYTPDYWNIDAVSENLKHSKLFLVEELQKAEFKLENNTLSVRNIGNVPYKKPIEVLIGGVSDIEELDLNLGESKTLKLGAPDGEYNIAVNDGSNKMELGTTFLTGRAIGIGEGSGAFFGSIWIWIWTLLIVILIIVILILWRKIASKNYVGKTPKIIMPTNKTPNLIKQENSSIGAVLNRGTKQEAGIIALKIKNLPELQKAGQYGINPLESLDKALLEAKAAGAKIYVDNDYRVMIFVPSITKEQDNSIRAIALGKEIETVLQNYNKSASNKINYGIGIHTGQVAVENENGKFKFVPLDNTVTIAKRAAEQSKGEALVSEVLHKKTLGKVKGDKVEGTNFWQVKQILDRGNYDEFIKRFLARQKRGG